MLPTSAPITSSPITSEAFDGLESGTVGILFLCNNIKDEAPNYEEELKELCKVFFDLRRAISDQFGEEEEDLPVRRLDSPDDATQDEIMKKFIEEVVTFLNEVAATFPSVNMDFDVILDEFITVTRALIKVTRENNPALATTAPTTSVPTTSAPTTSVPTTSAPVISAPTTSAPTTSAPVTSAPMTSAPKTSSPTTSVPMTSVPTISVPTTSTPTVTSSVRSPHPTYDFSAYCNDKLECASISQLPTAKERKQACQRKDNGKETCPIACGNLKCYKFTQACEDLETEEFTVMNTTQTCRWIKWMRVSEKNPNVPWICRTAAVPMNSSNVALDFSKLAQDRCQESCQNPACTCGDRTFPFWTEGYDTSDNTSMVDDAPARERNCADLYNMTTSERDTVCELDIHGVTAHLSKPTNDIPAIIKVNYMCPKACGNRTECFCTDSQDMIPTPNRNNTERQCFWAENWGAEKLAEFCDESIEPYFARACPITCKNPRCAEHDSTFSIFLFGNVVSTTCRQIDEFSKSALLGKDEEYVKLMCGAKDFVKMLFTHELCPVACKDVEYS